MFFKGEDKIMIRFYRGRISDMKNLSVDIIADRLFIDGQIWNHGKESFKYNLTYDAAQITMIPVEDKEKKIICYAYQDTEADRELRMLRELQDRLDKKEDILQFRDLYPDVHEVVICGCNELACAMMYYLEKQQIVVKTVGKYWEYFKSQEENVAELYEGEMREGKLVIYAEDLFPQTCDLYQALIRSVSSEFECVDKIYEANVKIGNICDTIGGLEDVFGKIRGKEIAILGTDRKAQNVYDFLYGHGIDIVCFVERKVQKSVIVGRTLLGKSIVSISDAMVCGNHIIFISCDGQNNALGTEDIDFLDYYGYRRNQQCFLIDDYTEIPFSNLTNVLKGKTVRVVGEEKLSKLLVDYLKDVEQGDIDVAYLNISEDISVCETEIICSAYPWYYNYMGYAGDVAYKKYNSKLMLFKKELSSRDISYTDYFSCTRAFVLIDLYRNRSREKYSLQQLTPGGILLGRIPYFSGNIFFRSILDEHQDILKLGYTDFNDNFFIYCICLAGIKSGDILKILKQMCMEGWPDDYFDLEFADWDFFERCAEELLSLKECFTSQELFVLFHIAYSEMTRYEKIDDIKQKIIYWEPHAFVREDFPFLAQWLDSDSVRGRTIYMHRNQMTRAGSVLRDWNAESGVLIGCQFMTAKFIEPDRVHYRYWEEFHGAATRCHI